MRAWSEIVAKLYRNRHYTALRGMLVLPMTASRPIKIPTVSLYQSHNLPDLH